MSEFFIPLLARGLDAKQVYLTNRKLADEHIDAMREACRAGRFSAKQLRAEDFASLFGCAERGEAWRWCIALVTECRRRAEQARTERAAEAVKAEQPHPEAIMPPVEQPAGLRVTRDVDHVGSFATAKVNEAKKAETEATDKYLRDNGFVVARRLRADGEATLVEAVDTYRGYYKQWADLPKTRDGLASVRASIQAEARDSVQVDPSNLYLDTSGGEVVLRAKSTSLTLALEERGWSNLLGMLRDKRPVLDENGKPIVKDGKPVVTMQSLFPGSLAWMRTMKPGTLIESVNRHIRDYAATLDASPVVLFHRRQGDSALRSLYNAATPSYAPFDALRSIDELTNYLGRTTDELRGPVLYDPVTTSFSAHAQSFREQVHNLSVGDAFQTVLSVRNHDSKGGGIVVQLGVVRVQCINLTTATDQWTEKLRHAGNMERIDRKVAAVHAKAGEFTRHFLAKWGQLRGAPLRIGRSKYDNIADAIEQGVESGKIKLTNSKERDREALQWAALAETNDNDQRTLVNAITRAAQWSGFERDLDTFAQERVRLAAAELAGNLVFAA